MTIKIGSSTSNKYEPEIVNEIIEKMQKSSWRPLFLISL